MNAAIAVLAGAARQGLAAARANLLPGGILQVVALVILLAYYFFPPVTHFFAGVAAVKEDLGLVFSAFSTIFFGAILPFFIQRLFAHASYHDSWRGLVALSFFWAYRGVEVDLFYRLQAVLFGTGHEASTLVCKVAVDQFVYSALWAVPTMVAFYVWKDSGFCSSRTREALRAGFWTKRVLPTVFSNWGVWIPAVTMVYCLPTPLQLPMQNIILCIFVLLISVLSKQAGQDKKGETASCDC